LAPPGEVFVTSQAPKTPAHWGDESLEFMVMWEALGFVALGHAPEVTAMGYAHASPGHV